MADSFDATTKDENPHTLEATILPLEVQADTIL